MFHSKTFTLFLLGLTWSISCLQADAALVRRSNVRGRWLQEESTDSEEIPSADTEPAAKEEKAPKTVKGVNTRSGVIGPEARECTTKQSRDKVEFKCKSVTDDGTSQFKDTLHFKVGASKGDHLKITVEYDSKWETLPSSETEPLPAEEPEPLPSNETEPSSGRALQTENATDSEIRTKYTLVYDRLIEYRKNGTASDQHFEWGVDEIVAEYPMDKWDELTAVETNGDLLTFSATVGMATFNFTITQTDTTDITTNKMKIDFLLENYPWAESGDTYIALVSHIETERKTKTGRDGPASDRVSDVLIDFEEAAQTFGFVPFGEYTWASTAEATVSTTAAGDLNGTEIMMERSANASSTNSTGNFTSAGTIGNFTSSRTATISVVASSSNRTDEGPGARPDNTNFQEIAFSFVGAGKGAERIFWDPEAGIGYTSSATRIVGSLVLLASSLVVSLLL